METRVSKRKRPAVAGRRGPSPAVLVGVVIVVLFAAVVGFGVYRANRPNTNFAIPPNATATGVIVGQPSAKATVEIYLDFQCPVCQQYEQQVGPAIDQLVAAGQAKVYYHPVAFLDRFSSTNYSTRSSQASGCAAADGQKVFAQYVTLLYANQPPENGNGLPADQLIALGKQAGAGPAFAQCVNDATYAGWTKNITDAASKAGINATPTVLVNGQQIAHTEQALRQAVTAAQ